ncbi:MAG: ATP-binding protein [Burkholderiales bacterium]
MRYFYIVFLPMVWAALRGGLAGSVLTATLAQLAIIAAVQLRGFTTVTVFDVQALAVVLILVGFLVGVFIDEQRRLGAELRQSLRLAAAGEMAAALAHELNQPLTAMSAYGAACEDLISQGEQGERLLDMVRRMVSESHRTADVVTRLRDFFRTGDTRLELVPVAELLSSAAEPFAARAARSVVELSVRPVGGARVLVDRLQIEVVMRNLVVNAFEAVEAGAQEKRWVRIGAEAAGPGRICLTVEDSGPGPGGFDAARLFEPFHSSKSSGLGLGLAISRSIAEAHGGRLWAEAGDNGVFKLLLPLEEKGVS